MNTSGSGNDELDTWVIVLIACGGIAAILAVIGVVFYGCKSNRSQSDKVNVENLNRDAEERQESQVELSKNIEQATVGGQDASSMPVLDTDEENNSIAPKKEDNGTGRPEKREVANDLTQ